MALSKIYQPYTRLGHEELDGLLKMLGDRVAQLGEEGDLSTPYYVGAFFTLQILRFHNYVDVPNDFIGLFNRYISELNE